MEESSSSETTRFYIRKARNFPKHSRENVQISMTGTCLKAVILPTINYVIN
jgi:hypothetical protein